MGGGGGGWLCPSTHITSAEPNPFLAGVQGPESRARLRALEALGLF